MSRLFRRNSILAWALAACAGSAETCAAAPGDLLYSIPNPDSEMYTLFGEVIAATNETIVIGAPQTPVGDHPVAGRAYVYDASDGALRYTLENPEPDVREMFGRSAASAGGHVVVGSSGLDAAAYVFDEQTGRYQRTITDGTPREDSAFSSSLIGNGPNVLIGSPQHFVDNIQAAGGVFLIDPADGESSQTYENPFPTPFAGFGSHDSVATSGRHVFVGELYERGPDGWIRGTVWAFDAATGEVAFNVLNPSPESADLPEGVRELISAVIPILPSFGDGEMHLRCAKVVTPKHFRAVNSRTASFTSHFRSVRAGCCGR